MKPETRGCAHGGPVGPAWPRISSIPLIPILFLSAALAAASPGPRVLLYGADLDQVRDFAISAALERGWRLVSVTGEGVTFEQTLDEPNGEEGLGPSRVIRVLARINPEGDAVRVQLSAQEVEYPGRAEEWSDDVTDRYGLNLANALSSLRSRWDARIPSQIPRTDVAPRSSLPTLPLPDRGESLGVVGTWAYYAEGYAQSRSCVLTDTGARLESAGADWERHRVPCKDGGLLHVFCRFGDCTAAPN